MKEPNWEEMQVIGTEATRLQRLQGKLTQVQYASLLARAKVAIAGDNRLIEFIVNFDPGP